jgi:hypothetical protein
MHRECVPRPGFSSSENRAKVIAHSDCRGGFAGGFWRSEPESRSSIALRISAFEAESRICQIAREKAEFFRDRKVESLRVSSHKNDLVRIVAEFQNHIADQHHHFVSCKKCRQFTKQMTSLSKKIEGGVR